jgi:hypothetical protein
MPRNTFSFVLTISSALLITTAATAETPPDPLRLIPEQADLLIKVEKPRALIETLLNLEVVKQLQGFEAFQEFYDSTNLRRFYQLIAYFEKELGGRWPDLLDRLAGGGIAIGAKLGDNPAPALIVVQSKDAELLAKFVKTVQTLIEQEMARQEAKERLEKGAYRKVETFKIGKDFHAAVAGSALLISNKEAALHKGLDLHLDGGKSLAGVPSVAEARKLLPEDQFAWLWVNAETVRKQPGVKEAVNPDAGDPNLLVLFGGWLDQFRRSPFLCAGFGPDGDGLRLTFRTPCGRDGMSPGIAAMHTPSAEQGGALPLLEPKGVLFSMSYVLDLKELWEQRAKILNETQVKQLEEFDRNSGKFLGGNKVSWLLTGAGPHQRFVAAVPSKNGYKIKPAQTVPAFAFVVDMRDPKAFSPAMETVLRTAALGASFSPLKLKMVDEKHGDLTIVGYRMSEEQAVDGDTNDIRFNFSPCFVAVEKQFVIASTMEFAHELIDLLQKEAKAPVEKSQTAMRMRFYPSGAADYLQTTEDQLLAQTILDRALAPKEAKEQVKKFIDLVRRAGALEIEQTYGDKDFRYEIKYRGTKP